MGKYAEDAKQLLRLVGGKENIAAVSHCMTRMRFVLVEPQKADVKAIEAAYPNVRKSAWKEYEQDGICDTWEVLANAVYPGGLAELRKKAAGAYKQIGIAKCEWARLIGAQMSLTENASPGFHFFVESLTKRIETA